MLIKCESKSSRVKGLSFHRRLSWILVSLHNGVIQLWDYRLGCLIEKFEEHDGPVRTVDFHSSQPIFVSGGDDYKVKLWNYKQRKSIFTLTGHLDYIRTVQFHKEYPWVVSASDDQTVRIWNWQSRLVLAVLAGHNHYVMSACFHPREDLLASASLDQTIRIWDLSGLREKSVSTKRANMGGSGIGGVYGGGPSGGAGGGGAAGTLPIELFGTTDAVCKFVLEGHDRGVNYVTFHPTLPIIASAADDRLIKIWRYDDSKWWELDTLRGHFNNVSSLVFHPQRDLLVSNSEDRTIRIWDLTRRTLIHTFRRDNDRFWIITALPQSNLLAVGHDSGMVVFKLEKERPASSITFGQNNSFKLFYVKEGNIHCCQVGPSTKGNLTGDALPAPYVLCPVRKPISGISTAPHTLQVNHLNTLDTDLLVFYKGAEGDNYDIMTIANDPHATKSRNSAERTANMKLVTQRSGHAVSATFYARNRYATVDGNGQIALRYLNTDIFRLLEVPYKADALFYGGNNCILIRSGEQMTLYDVANNVSLGEVTCSISGATGPAGRVRYVVWSSDMSKVALIAKHYITLLTRHLKYIASTHDSIRIKGGAWDEFGNFVYSTVSHVKYLTTKSDQGVLMSLTDNTVFYVQAVQSQDLLFLDNHAQFRKVTLEMSEYLLKMALELKRYDQVAHLICHRKFYGNSLVGYLMSHGYQTVALHVVEDPALRFKLSIDAGDIAGAFEACQTLDNPEIWSLLGDAAMKWGYLTIAERAFQRGRIYSKLLFFYLTSGNFVKLQKLGKIAVQRKDHVSAFHIAMACGEIEAKIQFLLEKNRPALALAMALSYGVQDEKLLQDINDKCAQAGVDPAKVKGTLKKQPDLVMPAIPLHHLEGAAVNWPRIAHKGTKEAKVQNEESLDASNFDLVENRNVLTKDALRNLLEEAKTRQVLDTLSDNKLVAASLLAPVVEASLAQLREAKHTDSGVSQVPAVAGLKTREASQSSQPTKDAWGDIDDDGFFQELGMGHVIVAGPTVSAPTPDEEKTTYDSPTTKAFKVPPSIEERWLDNECNLAADYAAAGAWEQLKDFLTRRVGLSRMKPMIPYVRHAYQANQSFLQCIPFTLGCRYPLTDVTDHSKLKPKWAFDLTVISSSMQKGEICFTNRQVEEAAQEFRSVLCMSLIARARSADEEAEIRRLIALAAQYALASCILRAAEEENSLHRKLELGYYATLCNLSPAHRFMVLKAEMSRAIKVKNYVSAALYIKRMLQSELLDSVAESSDGIEKMKKVLAHCESLGTEEVDSTIPANTNPSSIRFCGKAWVRLPPNDPGVSCAVCGIVCLSEHAGSLCPGCTVCRLGARVLGLMLRPPEVD